MLSYTAIPGIYQAIIRLNIAINSRARPLQHYTGSVESGLINYYFNVTNGFIITPEQIQINTRRKPEFSTERNGELVAFSEFKRADSKDNFQYIILQ
ncbi:MAG: hypothetical protein EOP34_00450 [Rickettsiales bacterium]|jgi:hypothetical protein|nr:MAG: hypothetical protein EOP34_00450 [Rickettsiales bacterium]